MSWDQPLNHNLLQQYKHLSRDLKSIEDIDTPRFILDKNEPSKNPLQLHCFCDASTTAYAAVVYIRQPVSQGHFQSQLLVAKTRVAPIKTLCVPRLELCAALLGAQLVQSIRIALDDERFPNLKVFAWTDSTITLAWIKNHPNRWKTFVANCVAKIQKSVPAENWNHVPTESNPADCASRGMSPRKLQSHHLWWQGLEWLRMPASAWPQIDIALPEESLKEAKRLNNSVQLDYRKLVSINTHDDTTQKQPSLVYLPVRKQAILNHNKEETAATAKAPEEEEPKEQADDQKEEQEQEEEDEEEEEEEEPQPHPENSSQSHQSNRTSIDYTDADNAILVAANKFSSFKKLVKVFGFVLRFVSNVKQNKKPTEERRKRHALHNMQGTATLSAVEIEEARLLIFRTFQKQHLTEFEVLKQNKRLPRKSTLRALAPFFDEEKQILRVGGRLANSNRYHMDSKFPIIVPRRSIINAALIRETHLQCFHGGWQLTLSTLRQTVWIPNVTRLIQSIIRKCPQCARFNSRQRQPQMGDLPQERISPSTPFSHIGLDYCGPITTKTVKTYVAIFICFSTKAVHLELVNSLTKEACISTLQRFFGRRGLPSAIYSDNSRTFTGTHAELEIQRMLAEQKITESLEPFTAYHKIQWLTIPPRSPNFGGLWEAAVKSFKRHFLKTTGKTTLPLEELTTLLTQIEAIMNSRPLTSPSNDPNDFQTLTPAHFLIGRPLLTVPDSDPPDKADLTLIRRFQQRQQAMNFFWKRWSSEYLTTLQQRTKWTAEQENLQIEDIVFLKDDNTSPMMWPMAKVIKVFDGNDQIARVVEIRTRRGSYVRPVHRLSLFLPAEVSHGNNQEINK